MLHAADVKDVPVIPAQKTGADVFMFMFEGKMIAF